MYTIYILNSADLLFFVKLLPLLIVYILPLLMLLVPGNFSKKIRLYAVVHLAPNFGRQQIF